VQYHDFSGAVPYHIYAAAIREVKLKLAPPGTGEDVCSVACVDTFYGRVYAVI
jgi:hypothetical protein